MEIATDVMKAAFDKEVVGTIKIQLKGKYTDSQIDDFAKKSSMQNTKAYQMRSSMWV